MGQMTYGILYGIAVGDDDAWLGEDGEGGHLGEYKTHRAPDIERAAASTGLAPWNLERRFVPDAEWVDDEGGRFVGFWISRGASACGLSGAVEMSRVGVRTKYPKAYKNARIRWRRFAVWCAATGRTMDKARLWLLETEVA